MLDLNKLDRRSISVKNLPVGVTVEQMKKKFYIYGYIKDISFIENLNKPTYACVKFEHDLSAKEATLKENGTIWNGSKIEINHRVVVVSFEGNDYIRKQDSRVPSAVPPNTNNSPYYKGNQYFANRHRNDKRFGKSAPSSPLYPRSFPNSFYSTNFHQFDRYGINTTGFNGPSYYSIYGGGNYSGPEYIPNGYFMSMGYYPPSMQNTPASPPLEDSCSTFHPPNDALSGSSSVETESINSFTSANTNNVDSLVNYNDKDETYFYTSGFTNYYNQGNTVPMMGTYGTMMFPTYYQDMQLVNRKS